MLIQIIFMAMLLCPTVSGQTEQFEQECSILQTLDTLEVRLQQQQALVEEHTTHLGQQETRLREQAEEIATLKQQNSELRRHNPSSTYVRWGRTTCPGNGSELVYSGQAGGSQYYHTGAAVNQLCLPTDPSFAYYDNELQISALVYGAEYKTSHGQRNQMKLFPDIDPDTPQLDSRDVPCAVCKTPRSTVLMVPARTTCHDGWTLEYTGYLSAGHIGHPAATQYVCLDGKPEYLEGGASDDNGALFYIVEGRCGSLRCPPYVDGQELTCAVCSI